MFFGGRGGRWKHVLICWKCCSLLVSLWFLVHVPVWYFYHFHYFTLFFLFGKYLMSFKLPNISVQDFHALNSITPHLMILHQQELPILFRHSVLLYIDWKSTSSPLIQLPLLLHPFLTIKHVSLHLKTR